MQAVRNPSKKAPNARFLQSKGNGNNGEDCAMTASHAVIEASGVRSNKQWGFNVSRVSVEGAIEVEL
jgi:hypothetical protein